MVPPERLELLTHSSQISCSTSYDELFLAIPKIDYHKLKLKLTTFGLPFGLPLCHTTGGYSSIMFLESTADELMEISCQSEKKMILPLSGSLSLYLHKKDRSRKNVN